MLRGRYKGFEPLDRGGVDSGVVQVVLVNCCLDKTTMTTKQQQQQQQKRVLQLISAIA